MSDPHPQYGCPGSWTIISSYQGNNYSYTFSGYELDYPALQCQSGKDYLVSQVRGNLELWTSSGCNVQPIVSTSFVKDDPNCGVATKYDCINGACIPSTTYSTPGIYANLEACEVACGTGCSGVCISNSDWAKIEGLSSQLKNKNCS
ncbi:hypothetical protein NIES2100_14490 [Calothrix sp. NIES-2100]|uniref:hypothetical protein n=1 Tax=Calothrix sp. NIES-2100 TaxID=1954172 RepID=UPI000B5FFD5D|nr:hypothetical protein NIES2100_14490 [Calothrix sp. NIES-2100]